MDWLYFLTIQGTLKSLLQHHSSKAPILHHSAFFIVQLAHPYMTTGKIKPLTKQTFFGKVMSLLFNIPSRLVIDFLPRNKRLLISWLQSPSVVILEPPQNKVCHCFRCFPIYLPWSDGTRWSGLVGMFLVPGPTLGVGVPSIPTVPTHLDSDVSIHLIAWILLLFPLQNLFFFFF